VADLLEKARGFRIKVQDGGGSALGLELEGVTDTAVVVGLTPLAEGSWSAARHQWPQKLLLFEGTRRTQHRQLGLVCEAEGEGLVRHQRAPTGKGRAKAVDRIPGIFQP
jgi:hypothetical protein